MAKKSMVKLGIILITLLIVFSTVTGVGLIGSAASSGVISTGRRTITQPLAGYNATDLHFIVYQADRDDAWILDWSIKLNVAFTTMNAVPDDWPFDDGRIHSVAIDIYGIDVPYGATVDIDAVLNLNEYNTVKFTDIKWTYKDHDPVDAMSANTGWAVKTSPGTSNGGWLISKYTTIDKAGTPVAVDLVGHQYRATDFQPVLQDMNVSNGVPGNPGTNTVWITNWGVALVSTLPSWDEIKNWQKWDSYISTPIELGPGKTIQFPGVIPTTPPTPTITVRTPTPTTIIRTPSPVRTASPRIATPIRTPMPTPVRGVIATGRRTITQPLPGYNATDLHFIVYQADRYDAWILNWTIKLNVPFTSMNAVPDDWPFEDGRIHSVAIDIYGIDVPYGGTVNIEAILNLNEFNTVKFTDIKWTYKDHAPVDAMSANTGWSVKTTPGTSNGGWLISKYTTVDQNGKPIAVDLVGHQYRATDVKPVLQDMNISNGAPGNPGTSPVWITNWGVALVSTLPTWDEIDKRQTWDMLITTPILVKPGQTVQFPGTVVTPTPTPVRTATPIRTAVTTPIRTAVPVTTAVPVY